MNGCGNKPNFRCGVVNFFVCVLVAGLLFPETSSWRITKKCPYGHYINDGCVTCWCDMNTGQTNCQRSSSCQRVNVNCPNGKVFKDECGNSCNCYEDTGAVFCNNINLQCNPKKVKMNKEDLENSRRTTQQPAIAKINIPNLIPLPNSKYEILQPLVLRRSAILPQPPLYPSTNYRTKRPTVVDLYDKIRKIMSRKLKETIEDAIKDELRKPLDKNMFQESLPKPIVLKKSDEIQRKKPWPSSYLPQSIVKSVPETIEEEIPKSVSSNIHEVFVNVPPTSHKGDTKSVQPIYNFKHDFRESDPRDTPSDSYASESGKVYSFIHPSSGPTSNLQNQMKRTHGNSFQPPSSTTEKRYSAFTASTPSLIYEEATRKPPNIEFPVSTPIPHSFPYAMSGPHSNSPHESQQNALQPTVYNIILSTPRPLLYESQSDSLKPIIKEYEHMQESTIRPQFGAFPSSTPKSTVYASMTSSPNFPHQSTTLEPSIYDFSDHSRKKNFNADIQQPKDNFHESTPSSILYDFPQSTQKPLNFNFLQTSPRPPQQYNIFNRQSTRPLIRLIFQHSTPQPHNHAFNLNTPAAKSASSNYFRTTSIADPSRFIFHQMSTQRPMMPINGRPANNKFMHQFHSSKPSIHSYNNSQPFSTNNMQVQKESVVYIIHNTGQRNGYQNGPQQNYFERQPLLEGPTNNPYAFPPTVATPFNFYRNTNGIHSTTSRYNENRHFNRIPNPTISTYTITKEPTKSTLNFAHLSPHIISHRLEDEIPKPTDFNFQEHTPEQVTFNPTPHRPRNRNRNNAMRNQRRKPVILKYKNWASGASSPTPATVRNPTTTRRPRPKLITRRPVDTINNTPVPTTIKSTPVIRIHNKGTRTDNVEFDYNSYKINNENTVSTYEPNYSSSTIVPYEPNYISSTIPQYDQNFVSSTLTPVASYDYDNAPSPIAKPAESEAEEEINHAEMIPKELTLDPKSGPMTVVFDHQGGKESLKFSNRKGGQDGLIFSQENPRYPVVIKKQSKSRTDIDLGEILVKAPEEEYKPVLVDLERSSTPSQMIVFANEDNINGDSHEYHENPLQMQENSEQMQENPEPVQESRDESISYYDDKREEEMFTASSTPSTVIYDPGDSLSHKDEYETKESVEKQNYPEDTEPDNKYKEETVNYADNENQQEPSTFVDSSQQETQIVSDYEQTSSFNGEREKDSYSRPQFDPVTPRNVYAVEQEVPYYDTHGEKDSISDLNVTPINFDFPTGMSTAAPNGYDHTSFNDEHDSFAKGSHQFMHKSGEELLSDLPLVQNKGELLHFEFKSDKNTSKKPLLISFKKEGRPPRANGYLKTDAVAEVFSFYHKMRQESAKRAIAAAEKRRLLIPIDNASEYDYNGEGGDGGGAVATDNETRKVSRGTIVESNDKKRSRVHSRDIVHTTYNGDTNERDPPPRPMERYRSNKDLSSKLDWKLEIEV